MNPPKAMIGRREGSARAVLIALALLAASWSVSSRRRRRPRYRARDRRRRGPGRWVRHAQLESRGRGDRLPDRADAGERGERADGSGADRRALAADTDRDPGAPTFADAGFVLGARFQWRVRARMGSTELPFSAPVVDTARPQFGDPSVPGENLRTQFELTDGAEFTNDVNEFAYTAALGAASDRVRVVEVGRTLLGRPINMMVFGYPKPRPTAAAISSHPSVLISCNVHGEPSMRESCMILARSWPSPTIRTCSTSWRAPR